MLGKSHLVDIFKKSRKTIDSHLNRLEIKNKVYLFENIQKLAKSLKVSLNWKPIKTIVVAIGNHKGGILKSNLVIHIAHVFAKLFNLKVLVVSADPQGNVSSHFANKNNAPSLYDLLESLRNKQEINLEDYIVKSDKVGCDMINTNLSLGYINHWAESDVSNINKVIKSDYINDNYDIVIFDTPPSFSNDQFTAVIASDYYIIALSPDLQCLEGYKNVKNVIDKVNEHTKYPTEILGGILTKYSTTKALHESMLEHYKKTFPHKIFESTIPESVYGEEVFTTNTLAFETDKKGDLASSYIRTSIELAEILKEHEEMV